MTMATHHYTAADFAGILVGLCLFAFVAFMPGYAIGWLADVLQFRRRTLRFQIALSVPLSIAVGPVAVYLIRSLSAAAWMYGAFAAIAVAIGIYSRPRMNADKSDVRFLGIAAAWAIVAILSLADLQIGNRLYFSIIDYDYSVRAAFTDAIERSGVPAANPFFFPGQVVALRYHYYWLLLCALVAKTGGSFIDARQAMIAGTVWCGIGLLFLVPLYLRIFSPRARTGLSRRTMIAASLLAVTGLDILPTAFLLWLYSKRLLAIVYPSVEMWNEQIDGWMCTMLWEPHYLASMIACFTGFLILWEAPRRKITAIIAGLAFATAAGSGIYVAFVFALFLCVWFAITILKRWRDESLNLAIAGATAIAASIPFVLSLRAPGSGGEFLSFTVRSFRMGEIAMASFGYGQWWQMAIANFAMLPLNYALELGFFGAAGLIAFKQFRRRNRPATRQELAALTLAAVSIIVCTFLRSGVINSNDLGWRGLLVAQFILLISAADLLSGPLARFDKIFLGALIALGAAGVLYDLMMLRFFPMLSDAGRVPRIAWLSQDDRLGQRTYANREAYEWLRARTARDEIIQQSPQPELQDTFYMLYGARQTLAEDTACATVFGGNLGDCAPVFERTAALYAPAGNLQTTCAELPADIFIAKDTDAVWRDRQSWVWKNTPIFNNDYVRMFACAKR